MECKGKSLQMSAQADAALALRVVGIRDSVCAHQDWTDSKRTAHLVRSMTVVSLPQGGTETDIEPA